MQNHDSQPAAVEDAPRTQHSDAQPSEWRTLAAWLAPARAALAGSLAVLAAAKLAAVAAPVLYKYAVDALVAPGIMPDERMLALARLFSCAPMPRPPHDVGFGPARNFVCAVSRKIGALGADMMPAFPSAEGSRTLWAESAQGECVPHRPAARRRQDVFCCARSWSCRAVYFELVLCAGGAVACSDWRYALLLARVRALSGGAAGLRGRAACAAP